jgi:hypothetical protein
LELQIGKPPLVGSCNTMSHNVLQSAELEAELALQFGALQWYRASAVTIWWGLS